MTKRLLIIGQAPSRAMQPGDYPLTGTRALTLLAKHAGVSPKERLYDLADFVNLVEEYPGPDPRSPKHDYFPEALARQRAKELTAWVGDETDYKFVVTLGSHARKAFKALVYESADQEWFSRNQCGSAFWYPSPHPGGTSTWWNDTKNLRRGQLFWTGVFQMQDASQRSVDSLPEVSQRKTEMWSV